MNRSFLEDLAEARPEPGGGAAAAYGVSLGLALVTKVARLEMGRATSDPARTRLFQEMLARLAVLKRDATRLREEDCRAYQRLAEVRAALSHREMVLAAMEEAVLCPIRIARTAEAGLVLIEAIGGLCWRHLVPDLYVAAEFLGAAVEGAYRIADANFTGTESSDGHDALRLDLEAALLGGRSRLASVRAALQKGV